MRYIYYELPQGGEVNQAEVDSSREAYPSPRITGPWPLTASKRERTSPGSSTHLVPQRPTSS